MRYLLIIILCLIPFIGNTTETIKISELGTADAATSDDYMVIVDDPDGSPVTKKITLGNLLLFFATQDMTLTGTIDASGATITWPATAGSFTTLGASGLVTANAGIDVKNGATDVGFIKIYEDSDDGTDYVTIKSQAMTTPWSLTLPAAVPTTSGQLAKFTNAGVMSFTDELTEITLGGFTASKPLASDGDGNATVLSTQDVITTGTIDGKILVTVSSSSPVTVSGSSGVYINGSDSVKTFNLPAAANGLGYCFMNMLYAQAITIHPASGDYIVLAGENNDADDVVGGAPAATDKICVLGVDTTYWLVTASTGTWAND